MFGFSTLMINTKLLDNNNENKNLIISENLYKGACVKIKNSNSIDPLLSFDFWRNCHIIESSQINKKNYLRIICLDSPGVIGKIGDIFGKNNVSIESIVQLDASEDKAEIVVISHKVNNGDFERSKDEINSLKEVKNIASQLSCI